MNEYRSSSACRDTHVFRWIAATLVLLALILSARFAAAAEAPAPEVRAQQAAQAFSRGQFEDAVEAFDAAATGFSESGDVKGRIGALLGKGNAYLALGRYGDAIPLLEDAQTQAKELADAELVAITSAALGNGYLLTGRADEAGTLLGAAITEARASGRWDIAARAGNDQGSRLASMDRLDIAIETYREALQDAERADDRLTAAKIRVNLARVLQSAERPDEARQVLVQAITELQTLPNSHEKAYALISAGRLFAAAAEGDASDQMGPLLANDALGYAAATAEAIDDPRALAYALGYQAELYEQAGRTEDALVLARQATFAAQRASAPEILYRWQWAVGRLLAEQGEIVPALESYQRAVYTLDTIRPDLVGGYRAGQASFREEVGPMFLELADLELQQAVAKTDAAEREASLRRVRETIEALKGVELADYFQDDCVAALKSRTVGIDQLADRTAAIYPHHPRAVGGSREGGAWIPRHPGAAHHAPVPATFADGIRLADSTGGRGSRGRGHQHPGHRPGRRAAADPHVGPARRREIPGREVRGRHLTGPHTYRSDAHRAQEHPHPHERSDRVGAGISGAAQRGGRDHQHPGHVQGHGTSGRDLPHQERAERAPRHGILHRAPGNPRRVLPQGG
jgi:tetratricopeptide (TPR) repeat protein